MVREMMIYEILDIDKEKVDEITKFVENLMFYTSYDITEIPPKIIEKYNDPKEVFLASMLFTRIHDIVINNKVYKEK